jgi:hypothetical protein
VRARYESHVGWLPLPSADIGVKHSGPWGLKLCVVREWPRWFACSGVDGPSEVHAAGFTRGVGAVQGPFSGVIRFLRLGLEVGGTEGGHSFRPLGALGWLPCFAVDFHQPDVGCGGECAAALGGDADRIVDGTMISGTSSGKS